MSPRLTLLRLHLSKHTFGRAVCFESSQTGLDRGHYGERENRTESVTLLPVKQARKFAKNLLHL